MKFGMQFFPCVGPDTKPADQYFDECLALVALADELDYSHVRIVEHYFHPYGGYSPNPIVFLTAASQRTKKARLITGAILPIFNSPLKLAGEIGMLDAISGGRIEVGFARAFLPHEFSRFGISLDESKARFAEGMAQIQGLLETEDFASDGEYHSFPATTSYPRPTQTPHPPFWIAAFATPESFANAGKAGHAVMAIPLAGGRMAELIGLYREDWKSAGHPGEGRVMLAFHLFCWPDADAAVGHSRERINSYLAALVDAASDWVGGASSDDYPGYDKLIADLAKETFESQVEKGAAWVGTPDQICDQISDYQKLVGDFEIASLRVNFHDLPLELAQISISLFAAEVMPKFKDAA
jgi:alkanesulfonate monooxygenase SsuD/methylene tetrahydromethanopterin reductase-like flavin-dependent oxidoreductase (luciferase family)